MDADVFDGTPDHLARLLGLIADFCNASGMDDWNEWTITCDAVSGTPDVEIRPDGEVLGLSEPTRISRDEAAILLDDPAAFARQHAAWAAAKQIATSMHIITLVNTRPGVPAMPSSRECDDAAVEDGRDQGVERSPASRGRSANCTAIAHGRR
jgi:hypothetical protein